MDAQARRRRILIVDDRVECARTLTRAVTMLLGHDARTARDGVAGVEAASEFRPEAVLIDIGMPGMDGYEVARAIRGRPWGAGATLIALTARGEEIEDRRFDEAGFDHHLAKLVDIQALVALIRRAQPPPT